MSDKSALERSWDENAKLRKKVELLTDTGKVLLDRLALLEKVCEAAIVLSRASTDASARAADLHLTRALSAAGYGEGI